MAHELSIRKNGFVEMAYAGDVPWHSLGNPMNKGEPLEKWVEKSGMDFLIKRTRVRYGEGENTRIVDDSHILFRSDTKDFLGIVSSKYKVVQPIEVLEFFRDLTEENGFELETAGTLFGGKKFWALAKVGDNAAVNATFTGKDVIKPYLLLSTSCDGSMPTIAKFETVRVVCNNTLSMALSHKDKANTFTLSHRCKFNDAHVKDQLGIATDQFAKFMKATRQLANTPMNNYDATAFVGSLLIDTKTVTKDDVVTSKAFKSIMQLFENGKGNHGETAWDLLNGITEYVDHGQNAKSDSHRVNNNWFGKGDDLKTVAFEKLLATV